MTLSDKEISFKRLLGCCETLIAESYSHQIVSQYLAALAHNLTELESERNEALTSTQDSLTTPITSSEALVEYRRKLNSLLYLADTAKRRINVGNEARNLQLIQNTSLSHDEKMREIEVRARVHNTTQQSMKDILFEEHFKPEPMTTSRKTTGSLKRKQLKGSLITEILEEQEKLREDTTDDMLLLVKGIKGVHEQVQKNIEKDNKDLDRLGDALGKDLNTTAARTDTLTTLLSSGTTSMFMYWMLIFFVVSSFFMMYIFLKLFPK